MEERNIKETLELLDGIELILLSCAKALKDGKINIEDLSVIFDLLKDLKKIVNAVQGINSIPKEISNLSSEEAAKLGLRTYQIMVRFKKEVGPK